MTIRVYNTLGGTKENFETIEPNKVRMYVCGVTPYALSHIGHGRCYVAFDVIFRHLKARGYDVTYVRNFTDVDDKIIKRAQEEGVPPLDWAEQNIQAFYQDMDALQIQRPDHEPRVSTTIKEIIELVQRLIDRGMAYEVEGDVYYSVEKFEPYGKLSGRNLDDMRAGARVEVDSRKANPMDFALWKSAKPGEISWESPWGPGRPGWHIECSAMSMSQLGKTIDLHGGGSDLVFPHHENEIAQSEGAHDCQYVRYWLHNGFVNIDNTKMSKSLGNVFNIRDLLARYEPQPLRFFLMSTQYRHPINFSDLGLDEAAQRVAYFYETLRKANEMLEEDLPPFDGPLAGQAFLDSAEQQFFEAMDDDFNTPRAMNVLFEAFKHLNEAVAVRKKKHRPAAAAVVRRVLEVLRSIDTVLGLLDQDPVAYLSRHRAKAAQRRSLSCDWIEGKVQDRLNARQDRDWAAADAIRDELLVAGVVIMDGTDGTSWTINDVRDADSAE